MANGNSTCVCGIMRTYYATYVYYYSTYCLLPVALRMLNPNSLRYLMVRLLRLDLDSS